MKFRRNLSLRQTGIASALALLLASTGAYGQSTTSSIFGRVPVQSGESVVISNGAGLTRTVSVDSQGRYNAAQLPVGTYSVTLLRDGKEVQRRDDVSLKVGVGVDISFSAEAAANGAANAKQLSGVNVTANAVPPIDVSSVDSRTVITAKELARLPLARTAEAAALLAPGAVTAAGGATSTTGEPLVSFGGSSSTENAYYINGFNTTDPFNAKGGIALPYGSIDQEEAYTGGYSAQYGRTDGGVINMIGKSGTNEWHFGAQYVYAPQDWRSGQDNTYYMNGLPPKPVAGRLYDPGHDDGYWNSTYDVYVGGPLIKDKLFMFASMEANDIGGYTVDPVASGSGSVPGVSKHYKTSNPKWYVKINWNINDSNLLELTGASEKNETTGSYYNYDYNALKDSGFKAFANTTKLGGDMWSAKYTSYLTDSLTLNAMYGKMTTVNYNEQPGYSPEFTYIGSYTNENPALNGGTPITNAQTNATIANPGNNYKTSNLRLSLTYTIGGHTITGGIDNLRSSANNQGSITTGPGYYWSYAYTTQPMSPITAISATGPVTVGPVANYPGGAPVNGTSYYVTKNVSVSGAGLLTTQRAEYIEDNWQVNDRWLLSIGLRNDAFNNYNGSGQSYMRQTSPQWAPRLGFSWDVYGDGTFKVYGNVGRYYLGQPLAPGGVANGVLRTSQYFTYTGIAADGTPTGLTQLSPPTSANSFFGQAPDPRTLTARNIKAQDQDEFILGFIKTAGPKWVYGAKFTRRLIRHVLDDYCDGTAVVAKAASEGITDINSSACYYINPGQANTFAVQDPSGAFHDVTLSNVDMGFPHAVRRYYALESFLEHPFDGKWYGKVSYSFSRSYGNSEGQGQSDIRAIGGIQNEDWDFPSLMVYAGGPQGNDHTHQIKAFGYYQITPEWLVSGNLSLISGGPKYCLGMYGTDPYNTAVDPATGAAYNDPSGYGSNYHWCNGQPSPPGAGGRLPWMKQVDLGVQYRPAFADHKLGLHLDVFNVFNGQTPLNVWSQKYQNNDGTSNPLYGTPIYLQPPRYVRMSVTYDY